MATNRDLRLSVVPGFTSYKAGTGILVSASENEAVVISDIIASTTGELRKNDSNGDVIITIAAAGHSNLVSPIKVTAGDSVYNANNSMNITINYWKDRA